MKSLSLLKKIALIGLAVVVLIAAGIGAGWHLGSAVVSTKEPTTATSIKTLTAVQQQTLDLFKKAEQSDEQFRKELLARWPAPATAPASQQVAVTPTCKKTITVGGATVEVVETSTGVSPCTITRDYTFPHASCPSLKAKADWVKNPTTKQAALMHLKHGEKLWHFVCLPPAA